MVWFRRCVGALLCWRQGNKSFDDEIINALPKESLDEFKVIHEEILKKGDLTEFYEKLKFI